MKKIIIFIFFVLSLFFSVSVHAASNTTSEQVPGTTPKFYQATVYQTVRFGDNQDLNNPPIDQYSQALKIKLSQGPDKGQIKDAVYDLRMNNQEALKVGEKVYVVEMFSGDSISYRVTDRNRLNSILWLVIIFTVLILAAARFKGVGSLLGLAFSFVVIMKLIVPWIMTGANPVLVCAVGVLLIATISIYLAHGFNLRITVAVGSTIFVIILAVLIDYLVVNGLHLYGTGSEEAMFVLLDNNGLINLRGLFLGGILIGALGVLDDITTAQVAVVDELKRANNELGFRELYNSGMSVGKEHISSLINTLVLAYIGASFPLVLIFWQSNQPFLFTINTAFVAEEIARTLIGSIVLIIAVPITTAIAAYLITRRGRCFSSMAEHGHHH
jgi:uncharacterized membrane protein